MRACEELADDELDLLAGDEPEPGRRKAPPAVQKGKPQRGGRKR